MGSHKKASMNKGEIMVAQEKLGESEVKKHV